MTRTELIAELRSYEWADEQQIMMARAADMLEADSKLIDAFNEWHSKTAWVQETAKPKELGMHRADVLKQRIDKLKAAARLALDALVGVVDFDPDSKAQWSVSGGTYEAHECNEAITALKEALK